jgi:hypothetical protein
MKLKQILAYILRAISCQAEIPIAIEPERKDAHRKPLQTHLWLADIEN